MNTAFIHDLNNKMTLLGASLRLVDKAYDSGDIDTIKRTMDKVKKYITNASDFVKTSLKEVIDPRVLACEVIDSIETNIAIEINQVQKGVHQVRKSAFTSVMENIIKNAEESHNVTKIRIYTTPSSITIFDNGTGFKNEVLQAFRKGQGKTTKTYGTGTGLLSIKQQMKAMGYGMSINNKNPGSCIQFKKGQFG